MGAALGDSSPGRNDRAGEHARGDVTANTVEGFLNVLKRGVKGGYQHCGEQHFQRYQ
jgi:hypothetical protein